jgi:nucleoside-diphosphate-sugar epimerase
LGAEGRISMRELAEMVVSISGKKIEIQYDSSHPTLIWGQALDCSLAASLLQGWHPEVSLRQGLEACYRNIETRLAKP